MKEFWRFLKFILVYAMVEFEIVPIETPIGLSTRRNSNWTFYQKKLQLDFLPRNTLLIVLPLMLCQVWNDLLDDVNSASSLACFILRKLRISSLQKGFLYSLKLSQCLCGNDLAMSIE